MRGTVLPPGSMEIEEMGIELNIRITSPLSPDDRYLLSGIAVMTLAIANRELASQGFPETFPPDETTDPDISVPQPCGVVVVADGTVCIQTVGHRGRHRFRQPLDTNELMN